MLKNSYLARAHVLCADEKKSRFLEVKEFLNINFVHVIGNAK